MNIENLFDALKKDEMNSALGILCAEFEKQGYSVTINNIEVSSQEFFNNKLETLEQSAKDFNVLLKKENNFEQEFLISFIDYHQFILKEKNPKLNYSINY